MTSHAKDFSLHVVFGALLFAECFVGIAINTFIVAVQFMRWKTLRCLDVCDKILTCLGMARCSFLYQTILYYSVYLFYPRVLSSIAASSAFLVQIVFWHYGNLWITTVLCVFYCVKIPNYSHKFLIFLKTRISRLVPLFLVAALLLSVAFSLPFGWCAFYTRLNRLPNGSSSVVVLHEDFQAQNLMFFSGSSAPFLIFCVAVCLLVRSLRKHARHTRSFRNLNSAAHVGAVKSTALLLFFHVTYFVCMCFGLSEMLHIEGPWMELNTMIKCLPPFLHSAYVISSNAKLKQAFLETYCGLLQWAPRRSF